MTSWFGPVVLVTAVAMALGASSAAVARPALVVRPLVEKKVSQLPAGPLFWRIETFATKAEAERAARALSLVAEAAGKVWLFTLGPAGGAPSPGGAKVGEVGPLMPVVAPQYLLRINEAAGPPREPHAGAQSSGVRGVLRAHRRAAHPHPARRAPRRGGPGGGP